MARSPVEMLEDAVAHHAEEVPAAVRALTPARRALVAATVLGYGAFAVTHVGAPAGVFLLVVGGPVVAALLVRGNTRARTAIARAALRAVERQRATGALGAGGVPVAASTLVAPPVTVPTPRALGPARRAARATTTGARDNDALDFDDA